MHRFYLPPNECEGKHIALKDREAHHALHVLRIREGEEVTVLDGVGGEYRCVVGTRLKKMVDLEVVQGIVHPRRAYDITLLQALPKGKLFDSIIQKATELGVNRIQPMITERVVMQLDKDDAAQKRDKWQQLAIEAIKQCGSPWLTKIETPVGIKDIIANPPQVELSEVGSLQPGSQHPRLAFENFERQHKRKPKSVALWVGPEGDFTAEEIKMIESTGAVPVTFGSLVLRVETAAIYGLSILNYELQAA